MVVLLFAGLGAWPLQAQSVTLVPANPDLQAALELASRAYAPDPEATAADVLALAQGDYERLLSVLYADGYFAPAISIRLAGREAAELSPLTPPDRVLPVDIAVTTGAQFRFGRAEIAPLPPDRRPTTDFATGAPAGLAPIREAARNGLEDWRSASHALARVDDQSITARHDEALLDVAIRIDPGPALRFGTLAITSDSAVRADRLRQIAGFPMGKPFDPQALGQARARLIDSGAFRSVVLRETETANPDGTLDVTLAVEDATPRRVGFGAEISNDAGLSFEAFWMHRNAFGGAERLRFELDIDGIGGNTDGIDYELGASLSIPGFRRADDTLTLEARLASLDETTFDSDIAEFGLRRARQVNEALTVSVGAGLRFAQGTDVFGERSFRHVLLDLRATYDARDDRLSPRAGFFADLHLQPFIGISDSASGVRITADGRTYRGIGARTTLAARFQAGTVLGPDLADVPPDFRFLSGGGGTVRGQSYQSLGVPVDTQLTGGRSFLGLSAELRQGLTDSLGLVAFADVGFVGADSAFSNLDSHAGFGIGARYSTGLGALRLDIGLPTEDPSFDKLQLYIGLGEAF